MYWCFVLISTFISSNKAAITSNRICFLPKDYVRRLAWRLEQQHKGLFLTRQLMVVPSSVLLIREAVTKTSKIAGHGIEKDKVEFFPKEFEPFYIVLI